MIILGINRALFRQIIRFFRLQEMDSNAETIQPKIRQIKAKIIITKQKQNENENDSWIQFGSKVLSWRNFTKRHRNWRIQACEWGKNLEHFGKNQLILPLIYTEARYGLAIWDAEDFLQFPSLKIENENGIFLGFLGQRGSKKRKDGERRKKW